eukprot:gene6791-13750_t
MKLNYRLSHICGNVFENGNLCFTPDGNSVISPVGNRITVFDLVHHSSITLPFENRKNIKRICISNNGRFLVSIDIEGHALFINFPRRVILVRHHFKRKVHDIKFSPNDEYFAVTFGRGCQIWKTPRIIHEFSPLTLCRNLSGHHDDVTCLDWSSDSNSIVMASKDLSARVYHSIHSKKMALTILSGHRDEIIGIFYSTDGNTIYSIARDGAIFTWTFEAAPRILIPNKLQPKHKLQHTSNDDTENEDIEDEDDDIVEVDLPQKTRRGGTWKLKNREFLWEPNTYVSSAAYNKAINLLVIGFSQGVFGLYELQNDTVINLQRLSVSHQSLNTCSINMTGEWLALGSASLGQLLVWEWKSESYVLKQQGHLYGLSSVDFSDDGQYVVTGGEDSKVKLWNTSTGFCFSTFGEHIAPVTGVKFVGRVRAHDMLRYRNFRTLTSPQATQFTCVAVDLSGEIVCAGSLDPFNIYLWTLQTGQLLDILVGHEGPIACLEFSNTNATIASGSWDGTLKIWNVYQNSCEETMEHGCDVLAVAIRGDGKEVCSATTNGNLNIWDIETGSQLRVIEGRRDIAGGRLSTDRTSAANSARAKYFTCVTYSSDGSCILAAGKSRYVCIYSVATGTLLKKFSLSANKSLEGILDELRSDRLVDGVAVDSLRNLDADSDNEEHNPHSNVPGAGKGSSKDGSRTTRPDISSTAVRFSATGREWAIFSLDEGMIFAPTDLDIAITPQTITATIAREEFSLALNMALHLNEPSVLKKAVDAISMEAIELVVRSIDVRMLRVLLRFIAEELSKSCHLEYYLIWSKILIQTHGQSLLKDSLPFQESFRALIRAVSQHDKVILKMSEENQYQLNFLLTQLELQDDVEEDSSRGVEYVNDFSMLNSNKLLIEDEIQVEDEVEAEVEVEYVEELSNKKKKKKSKRKMIALDAQSLPR